MNRKKSWLFLNGLMMFAGLSGMLNAAQGKDVEVMFQAPAPAHAQVDVVINPVVVKYAHHHGMQFAKILPNTFNKIPWNAVAELFTTNIEQLVLQDLNPNDQQFFLAVVQAAYDSLHRSVHVPVAPPAQPVSRAAAADAQAVERVVHVVKSCNDAMKSRLRHA